MDFAAFRDWVFLGLLSGGIYVLWAMGQKFDLRFEKLTDAIIELNLKMTTVIAHTENHSSQISSLDRRIEKLEDK